VSDSICRDISRGKTKKRNWMVNTEFLDTRGRGRPVCQHVVSGTSNILIRLIKLRGILIFNSRPTSSTTTTGSSPASISTPPGPYAPSAGASWSSAPCRLPSLRWSFRPRVVTS
jgi:hypothetical protein